MQPNWKKYYNFEYNKTNLNQEEWASKRDGENWLAAKMKYGQSSYQLSASDQCCDIRSDINQQICPLQYLLHRPWRRSILEFCTGEWKPGPIQSMCQNCLLSSRTAEHKTKWRVCNCLLLVNSTTNLYSSIKEHASRSKYYGHVHLFLITRCM